MIALRSIPQHGLSHGATLPHTAPLPHSMTWGMAI
jgi:hypothetical protein